VTGVRIDLDANFWICRFEDGFMVETTSWEGMKRRERELEGHGMAVAGGK
jgi:hypothetical protein